MTIPRCSNRPTKTYRALHLSPEIFDALADAVNQDQEQIVLESDPEAVLVLAQYVVVRKQA